MINFVNFFRLENEKLTAELKKRDVEFESVRKTNERLKNVSLNYKLTVKRLYFYVVANFRRAKIHCRKWKNAKEGLWKEKCPKWKRN